MEVRYSPDPARFCRMTTQEVRDTFLIESLFHPDSIDMVYSEIDRVIVGSAVPGRKPLELTSADELRADYPELEDEDIRQALAYAAAMVGDETADLPTAS